MNKYITPTIHGKHIAG